MILIVIPNNSWERYPAPLLRYSFKEFWIILERVHPPHSILQLASRKDKYWFLVLTFLIDKTILFRVTRAVLWCWSIKKTTFSWALLQQTDALTSITPESLQSWLHIWNGLLAIYRFDQACMLDATFIGIVQKSYKPFLIQKKIKMIKIFL